MYNNILLIDPDDLVRDSMTIFLKDLGFKVSTTTTAKQAIEMLRAEPREIVICARYLADMDCLTFMRTVQVSHPHTIRVLEKGLEPDEVQFGSAARLVGVDDFLTKPLTAGDIVALMDRLRQKYDCFAEPHAIQETARSQFSCKKNQNLR